MKSDLYTKSLLTVIAIATVFNTGQSIWNQQSVLAQEQRAAAPTRRAADPGTGTSKPLHVVIDGLSGSASILGLPVYMQQAIGGLAVRVEGPTPVVVSGVQLQDQGFPRTYLFRGPGPLASNIIPGLPITSSLTTPGSDVPQSRSKTQRWEYMRSGCDQSKTDQAGLQGWEAFGIAPGWFSLEFSLSGKSGKGQLYLPEDTPSHQQSCIIVYKRPLP